MRPRRWCGAKFVTKPAACLIGSSGPSCNRRADRDSRGRGYDPSSPAGMSRLCGPSAPILLRFSLHGWSIRVLGLDPVRRAPRAVARVLPLRHDALQPELAGVLEDERAVLLVQVLVEAQTR